LKQFKILVVDDSILMRQIMKDIILSDKSFVIAGEAQDGADAIEKFKLLKPDAVTLDIEMPKINGLICLQQIMRIRPVPVLIVSAYSKTGSKIALKALEYGAFDIVEKPSGSISIDLDRKKDEILMKLNMAVKSNMERFREVKEIAEITKKLARSKAKRAERLVAIAASTGGPKSLMDIIPKLGSELKAAISIVQHMPAGFTRSFSERINSVSHLNVFESVENVILNEGDCIIAQGGRHMIFDQDGIIRHNDDSPYHSVRPSADIMMLSSIRYFRGRIIGVVLTGMGKDGSEGVSMIKKMGGINIAESQESSVVFGMPKSAIDSGSVDFVLNREEIPKKIEELINEME